MMKNNYLEKNHLNEHEFSADGNCLVPAVDLQFRKNVLDVIADSRRADRQTIGDILNTLALVQLSEYFGFPACEPFMLMIWLGWILDSGFSVSCFRDGSTQVNENVLTRSIEQHQGADREMLALIGCSSKVDLESVYWLVDERRGADRTSFAAQTVAEYVLSGQ
jgi:hypothetical protein